MVPLYVARFRHIKRHMKGQIMLFTMEYELTFSNIGVAKENMSLNFESCFSTFLQFPLPIISQL